MKICKSVIRRKYQDKRNEMDFGEINELSSSILIKFLEYFKPSKQDKIHIFLSIDEKKEVNTETWVSLFLQKGIRVFVPRVKENKIENVEIDQTTKFIRNRFGILEPSSDIKPSREEFSYVITPLLYCDFFGNRVGYGKGFYDRLFQNTSSEVSKIGVNFFSPDEIVSDENEFDVKLDYLVTPEEVLSFESKLTK